MAKKKKDKKPKKDKKAKARGTGAKASKPKKTETKKASKKSTAAGNKTRALARKIIDLTAANVDEEMFEIYADNAESIEMNMPAAVGLDAIRAKFEGWHKMVSNPKFTAENVWVDGNTIIVEWSGNVTINATGRQAKLREIAVHEIKDGKIVRERYYYDPAALQP